MSMMMSFEAISNDYLKPIAMAVNASSPAFFLLSMLLLMYLLLK